MKHTDITEKLGLPQNVIERCETIEPGDSVEFTVDSQIYNAGDRFPLRNNTYVLINRIEKLPENKLRYHILVEI